MKPYNKFVIYLDYDKAHLKVKNKPSCSNKESNFQAKMNAGEISSIYIKVDHFNPKKIFRFEELSWISHNQFRVRT